MALLAVGVVRNRFRQRAMTPEERDADHARRLEEVQRRRPAWMNSPWWAAVLAAYWGWYAVAAGRAEVRWLAVADGLLCVVSIWSAVRVLRRRRVSSDS